ncbi:MAG: phage tail protein [Bernardetiaceae bacterium]|nr:phage tail protein [Bernardetiaceae bacterium]
MAVTPYDIPVAFHFQVEIGNDTSQDNAFQEVSGIEAGLESTTVKEGGENRFTYTVPTGQKYPNLILKRGLVTKGTPFVVWCEQTFKAGLSQPLKLKEVSVKLLNEEQDPIITWTFHNAYPIKWQIDALNAMDNKLVIETVELAYTHFEKQ